MKNFEKRVFLAVALTLSILFLLVGCVTVNTEKKTTTPSTKEPAATKDWKKVTSEDGNLSLRIPQDWKVKPAKELNLGVGKMFVAFGPADGQYTTNLQVSKESVSGADLSGYISQFEKNTKEDTSTLELKVIDEGKVKTDLGEGYRKTYSYKLAAQGETFNLTFDAFYLKKGDNFYVIQVVTTDKLYDDVKKIFDNILSTLTIK